MLTRREFLGLSLAALWLEPPLSATPGLKRWWPLFPTPHEIWVIPPAADFEEGILLETAAGLAARACLRTRGRLPLVYEESRAESYVRAFDAYCRANRPKVVRLNLDEAIERLCGEGTVRQGLVYRYDPSPKPLHDDAPFDESANAATSLSAHFSGLAVSEKLTGRLSAVGLTAYRNLRGMTEAACLQAHEPKFSREILGTCDPRARHARSLMVALGAFVCSARGEVYRKALARCRPDSPVLGWGCGPEDGQTIPSSRAGLYQTATDWCANLTVFVSEGPGKGVDASRLRAPVPPHWSTLDWGDGRHFALLHLSDGDNVQWEMANFARGPEGASYYDHPRRGQIPFGWGINAPTLAQLAPRFLEDIFTRATSNDGFVLFGGAGYFYPDLYGAHPGKEKAAVLHAERLRGYMDLTGIRTLAFNFQDWDSPAALKACETMARKLPGLDGILAFQYYPYSAGEGAVRWVRGAEGDQVPVASCSLTVWAQTGRPRDTTPAGVAAQINRMPRLGGGGEAERCFSWVLVHAWSRFRRAKRSTDLLAEERGVDQNISVGTERGYSPALWTAGRLHGHVRLVTPAEWLMRLRLRARPRATLECWLEECRTKGKTGAALARAERLARSADSDANAARDCFEQLRTAYLRS